MTMLTEMRLAASGVSWMFLADKMHKLVLPMRLRWTSNISLAMDVELGVMRRDALSGTKKPIGQRNVRPPCMIFGLHPDFIYLDAMR
jgi:hypothetical protein